HAGEVTQELFLLRLELGRRGDHNVHEQVTAADATQVRYAATAQLDYLTGLGARPDVKLLFTVQRRHFDGCAERSSGHGQRHGAVQVIAVALQQRMRQLV